MFVADLLLAELRDEVEWACGVKGIQLFSFDTDTVG
jgi:hypothetical protein